MVRSYRMAQPWAGYGEAAIGCALGARLRPLGLRGAASGWRSRGHETGKPPLAALSAHLRPLWLLWACNHRVAQPYGGLVLCM